MLKSKGMPIRLIAIDLDGTLINSRTEISQANRAALEAAAALGIEILITTGRRFHSAQPLLASLECPLTLVASNGALVATMQGDILRRDFLPKAVALEVLETTADFRPYAVAIFDVPGQGQILMQSNALPTGPLGWYLRTAPDRLLQVDDLPASLPNDPIQLMFGGTPAMLEPLEHLIRSSPAADRIHVTWTKYLDREISLLDVMNRGCSKASALRWWLDQKGLDPAEAMAIGDNFNDLEMLQLVGRPVVMANAAAGLNQDGWHTTLSHDEDGVATAIHKFALT